MQFQSTRDSALRVSSSEAIVRGLAPKSGLFVPESFPKADLENWKSLPYPALAAKYYMRRGYLLLNHNYRTRMGELDLVLYKDGQLVFAEVKTRAGRMLDAPAAAVDARKQRRLILAAQYYLQHSPYADASIRFDVVEVTPAGDAWQIHCIPDAFQC